MAKKDDPQFKLRIPAELKAWLDEQAEKNRSSLSSEVVRSIRERRERVEFKASGSIGAAA